MDVTKIVQDAKVGQQAGKNGAVVVQIQNVGDVAINKAAAKDGDVFAAMEYILARLPEPRVHHLKALAMVVARRMFSKKMDAPRFLGISHADYIQSHRHYYPIVHPVLDEGKEFPLLPESPG
jgi:hypothetical protein